MQIKKWLGLWCATLCLPMWATQVVEKTLPNGMQVLVMPDHRAPLVNVQVWYKVGSKDEVDGTTGIAHFLEHLMFMGTQQFPGGKFSERIQSLGGVDNAGTTSDFTYYYETVPSHALDQVLAYEADRMRGLQLEKPRVMREKQVVAEERRMRMEDHPTALAYEQSMAMLFVRGPYHHMPIGWMSDIQHYTMADAQAWYDRWYHPNHAVLVVVGDVVPQKVFKQVMRHFGPLQPQPAPKVKPKPIPPLRGEHVFVMQDPKVVARYQTFQYRVPSLPSLKTKPDMAYALEVLSAVLTLGDSAKLRQALQFKHAYVSSIYTDYALLSHDPKHFIIAMTLLPHVQRQVVVHALEEALQAMRTQPVSAQALARAKAQLIANHTFAQDDMTNCATTMGAYAVLGLSTTERQNYAKRIQAVTAQTVMQAARQYLTPHQRVVTQVNPLKSSASSHRSQA